MLLGNTELHFNFSRLSKGLGLGVERYDSGPPNTANTGLKCFFLAHAFSVVFDNQKAVKHVW